MLTHMARGIWVHLETQDCPSDQPPEAHEYWTALLMFLAEDGAFDPIEQLNNPVSQSDRPLAGSKAISPETAD